MSTIDPNSRWWNRASSRTAFSWILWTIAMMCCFAVGWLFNVGSMSETAGIGGLARSYVHDQPYAAYSWWVAGSGLAAVIVTELISRKLSANHVVRGRVLRGGIRTTGFVTHSRGYYENYHKVTRVTVKFTDSLGTQRWAKQTVGGTVRVGAVLPVQYLQGELDSSKAAVVIG